jgi:hypothetical protein
MDEELEKLIDTVEAVAKTMWSNRGEILALCAATRALDANLRASIADNAKLIELRSRVLKLNAERKQEREVWAEYVASLKGCAECNGLLRANCAERANKAKSAMLALGLPTL